MSRATCHAMSLCSLALQELAALALTLVGRPKVTEPQSPTQTEVGERDGEVVVKT